MSKTRLFRSIKALDVEAVASLLEAHPTLIRATDDRRRNPVHFLCSLPADPKTAGRSLTLARRLLDAGLDVSAPAFVEGAFQATPLLYAALPPASRPFLSLLSWRTLREYDHGDEAAPHRPKEGVMLERLISGDNHIDLTYCPPDLWSSQAPSKWKLLVPRVEELEDGCHWFVEAQDKGMWNGVGPGFLKRTPGSFARIDEMASCGFEWDHRAGARPRPTTPELRLADLDRDGLDAEVVYGCLMINDMIASGERRAWANAIYNDWAADFAKKSDPNRIYPLAIVPNNDPQVAAAEVRRCAKMGLKGGDLGFKSMSIPLYQHEWYPLWEAAAECHFPIAFHSTGFKALRAPDSPAMEQQYMLQWRLVRSSLFQLDTMEVLVSLITSGACEKYPDFKFVLGESGVTWLPYVFDRFDTEYEDRARGLGFSMKPSDYFKRQGYVTYQQDQFLEPIIPLVGEDNIIWGADYPHPDCVWPDSRRHLEKNLGNLPERVQRKITYDNVVKLYNLR